MKVKAFVNRMNDRGTNPRINVFKYDGDASILVYEGSPERIDESVAARKVNSFTVLGKGFIAIYAQ